jgi:hypothetical protein
MLGGLDGRRIDDRYDPAPSKRLRGTHAFGLFLSRVPCESCTYVGTLARQGEGKKGYLGGLWES